MGSSSGASYFSTAFSIGKVRIPNRVVLAPMAGLTCSAYRRHLKAHGAGLVATEMVSAHGLLHGNNRTQDYLRFVEEERPIAVQLFGDTPEVMAKATEMVLSQRVSPDLIDINMGCPVRKVVRTGAGSALMGDPSRAVALAAAVVTVAQEAEVPVTVKLRSGLREGERTVVDLATRLEAVGVQAIALHPRTADQYYRGSADHSVIADVVNAVGVPVMASGDISSVDSTLSMVEATGATAVMLARGAAGNPWLVGALLAGSSAERPPFPMVIADLRVLLRLVMAERGTVRSARWMRKVLGWYLRPSRVPVATIEHLRSLSDALALDEALAQLSGAEG